MNNEPVAWAREDGVIAFFEKPEIDKQGFKWFPLYTHPAKTLEPLGAKFEKVLNDNLWELMEESPAKTLTDAFIYENHVGYLSPSNDFYAPDYPTWKQDGFTPIYKEPVAKTLTDAEQDACFNRGYKEGARDILNRQTDLTDEEITQVFDECYPNNADGDVVTLIDFARAILRKAQENERTMP